MDYNTNADFSEITEGIILPFKIELDLANCVLSPISGENQKFSYIVNANGSDSDLYADMEYIILGIDKNITSGQIENITVEINGSSQKVRFDKNNNNNVSLVAQDESTGCAGLKFEFALSKTSDVMNISFEISKIYEIGSMPVCIYGESTAKTGLTIGGPASQADTDSDPDDEDKDKDKDYQECIKRFGYKVFNVHVPVSIKPYAQACEPEVTFLGNVRILPGHKRCDKEYESCEFTMTQKVSVKIPVEYCVCTHYDEICVDEEETDVESANEE